ncbi:MAG: hypothetical protein KDN19_13360 [Verrucomicrobiae bacterium]|nr:hypothetical protein [Verrucomicrobiae bacterium]
MKRSESPNSSVVSKSQFHPAIVGLFLVGYLSLSTATLGGEPVKILTKPMHLGDQVQNDMTHSKPDAKVFEAKFDWPGRIGFGEAYLIVDVSHMTPRDYPGFKDGFWQTEILINGESVGILNELLRGKNETAKLERIVLPFEFTAMKTGENILTIKPGAKNGDIDDLELQNVEISETKPER